MKYVSKLNVWLKTNFVDPFMLEGFEEEGFCQVKEANIQQHNFINIIVVDDSFVDMLISKSGGVKHHLQGYGRTFYMFQVSNIGAGGNPTNVRAYDYFDEANP